MKAPLITQLSLAAIFSSCARADYMVFEFPNLTGPYKVGAIKRHIIDQNRQEPHNPSEKRELMVHLWYPANVQEANPVTVYKKEKLETSKQSLREHGYLEEEIASLDYVFCHAVRDALPLKNQGPFPVVIFSHGYTVSGVSLYTAMLEELASNGYMVVAIEHTYYTHETIFPDGHTVSLAQRKLIISAEDDLSLWIADVRCVLDCITLWNSATSDALYGLFDITRTGMFGHSYGGGIAFELCVQDQRIEVGINLDAGLFGVTTLEDMRKPFMFMMGGQSVASLYLSDEERAEKFDLPLEEVKQQLHDIIMRKIAEQLNSTTHIPCIIIPDLEHMGFSDLIILKELPIFKNNKHRINLEKSTGIVDGFAAMREINKNIVGFFNRNI